MRKNNDNIMLFEDFSEDKDLQTDIEYKKAMDRLMNGFDSFLHHGAMSDEPETAEDFITLAEEASSRRQALKFAKMALKLEPDNIDAQTAVAANSSDILETTLGKIKETYVSATEQIKEKGFFEDEYIGQFWDFDELRPYLRLLGTYSDFLYNCGKMKLSAEILSEMIRLDKDDNLEIRYTLMHVYCYLEDKDSAEKLFAQFQDERSAQFFLPLAMLYYKLDDLKKAAAYLRKLGSVNNETLLFLDGILHGNLDEYLDEEDLMDYGYQPNSLDDLMLEVEQHKMLLLSTPAFFDWAYRKLKASNKKKK